MYELPTNENESVDQNEIENEDEREPESEGEEEQGCLEQAKSLLEDLTTEEYSEDVLMSARELISKIEAEKQGQDQTAADKNNPLLENDVEDNQAEIKKAEANQNPLFANDFKQKTPDEMKKDLKGRGIIISIEQRRGK